MDNFQSIEEKLHRLMPASLSDEAQKSLEDQIDQLAGVESVAVSNKSDNKLTSVMKIAAAIAFVASPLLLMRSSQDVVAVNQASDVDFSDLVAINTMNRIEGVAEDGLIYTDDGQAPHLRYRYKVTNEEQFRDESTGTVVTVSQPSYEVVTIPQTVF